MSQCKGIMGRIFGHKFFPVITKGPASGVEGVSGSAEFILAVIESTRKQTYHGCVCRRCGQRMEV